MRIWSALAIASLWSFSLGCGGSSNVQTSSSEVSGAYEFVITSNVTGSTTLVETNFVAHGNQSTASGTSQAQILSLVNKNWYVNGACFGATPGQNSVSATLSGGNVALMFDEGGDNFAGQGTLTGSTIVGNYAIVGSTCPILSGIIGVPSGTDSGGFTGSQVPPLAGTFSGPLNLIGGTDDAALTLTETANGALSVKAALNGPVANGTFTLTGSAVGNIMFASGSLNGKSVTWFGYFDQAGRYAGFPNSLLVFDYDTLVQDGLLIKP
jgi:hypothetical protein